MGEGGEGRGSLVPVRKIFGGAGVFMSTPPPRPLAAENARAEAAATIRLGLCTGATAAAWAGATARYIPPRGESSARLERTGAAGSALGVAAGSSILRTASAACLESTFCLA